jgi:hypothetical protein
MHNAFFCKDKLLNAQSIYKPGQVIQLKVRRSPWQRSSSLQVSFASSLGSSPTNTTSSRYENLMMCSVHLKVQCSMLSSSSAWRQSTVHKDQSQTPASNTTFPQKEHSLCFLLPHCLCPAQNMCPALDSHVYYASQRRFMKTCTEARTG